MQKRWVYSAYSNVSHPNGSWECNNRANWVYKDRSVQNSVFLCRKRAFPGQIWRTHIRPCYVPLGCHRSPPRERPAASAHADCVGLIRSQISLVDQRCPQEEAESTRSLLAILRDPVERVIKDNQSADSFDLAHLDHITNIIKLPTSDLPVITGIIDWEFHAAIPRDFASSCPDWLLYDGYYHPNFNPAGSPFYYS